MTTFLVIMMFIFPDGSLLMEEPIFVDFENLETCMEVTADVINDIAPDVKDIGAGWSCTPLGEIPVIRQNTY